MRVPFSAALGVSLLVLAACAGQAEPQTMAAPIAPALRSGVQTADMDTTVRPQDDFFAWANGRWVRDTPIPDDRSRYGVDSMMAERSLVEQRAVTEAAMTATDPGARKVGDLYAAFMDEAGVEAAGPRPLEPELQAVDALHEAADLAPLMARLDMIGVSTPIGVFVDPDAQDASRNALWLYESGLGLPDRDYYLGAEPRFGAVRDQYRAYVARMLVLAGAPSAQADSNAAAVLALETAIARLHWTAVDARDPHKTYNPSTIAGLTRAAPGLDWAGWMAAQDLAGPEPLIIVREPDFFEGLSRLATDTPLPVWRAYLRLRVLDGAAPFLPRAFADAAFGFNEGVLHGTTANSER
jgi:putative endopeptidase